MRAIQDRAFHAFAEEVATWIQSAHCTFVAARDAWHGKDAGYKLGPILMLRGLGLENLFKALLIVRGKTLASSGRLEKALAVHDLLKLSSLGGFDVSAQERAILNKLTEFVTWAGRYPIPKHSRQLALTRSNRDRRWSSPEEASFWKLALRLLQAISLALDSTGNHAIWDLTRMDAEVKAWRPTPQRRSNARHKA